MKKIIPLLLILLLLLAGCGKKPVDPAPTPGPEPSPGPDPIVDPDPPVTEKRDRETAYMEAMDGYEDLRIAFLGAVTEDQSLEDVLKRAKQAGWFDFLDEITEKEIVYGDQGKYASNVYLIIPAVNTDLKVGKYGWNAGEITGVKYEKESSWPILYIEDGDGIKLTGMIQYVRHLEDGSVNEGNMLTGISCATGTLRTAQHMGIVDVTDYGEFSTSEIPFYGQAFGDALYEVKEIRSVLDKGGSLDKMDEVIYEGEPYCLYTLMSKKGDLQAFYMIRFEGEDAKTVILTSADGQSWKAV